MLESNGSKILPLGANDKNNCVNSRCNSVIASYQNSILPTSSSGDGFRSSDTTTRCTRKESRVASQYWVLMCEYKVHIEGTPGHSDACPVHIRTKVKTFDLVNATTQPTTHISTPTSHSESSELVSMSTSAKLMSTSG